MCVCVCICICMCACASASVSIEEGVMVFCFFVLLLDYVTAFCCTYSYLQYEDHIDHIEPLRSMNFHS